MPTLLLVGKAWAILDFRLSGITLAGFLMRSKGIKRLGARGFLLLFWGSSVGCSQESAFDTKTFPTRDPAGGVIGSESGEARANSSNSDSSNKVTDPRSGRSDSTQDSSQPQGSASAGNETNHSDSIGPGAGPGLGSERPESENGSVLGQIVVGEVTKKRVQQEQRFELRSSVQRQEFVVGQRQEMLKWSFRQPNLRLGSVEKYQGTREKPQAEIFEQNAAGLLDVLVVVDNSGSMKEEQANLADRLGALLASVRDSNWQIGLISTDPKEASIRALIKKADADPNRVFRDAVLWY